MISGENGSGFNFLLGLFQSMGGNSVVKRVNGKRTREHGRVHVISSFLSAKPVQKFQLPLYDFPYLYRN